MTTTMKRHLGCVIRLLALVIFLGTTLRASAEVKKYEGRVEVKPESRELSANLTVTVAAGQNPLANARFFINKNLHIDTLTCDICPSDSDLAFGKEPFPYIIDSAPLTVSFAHPLAPGQETRIHLRYSGHIPNDPGPNVFTPQWVELGIYEGWFPCDPDSNNFTYDLAVNLPASYQVASSATVSGGGGTWRLEQQQPTFDIVLVASGNLKRRVVEQDGLRVALDYAEVDDQEISRLFADVRSTLEHYTQWYGHASTGSLELLLSSRPGGGGYARPGFISLPAALYKQNGHDQIMQGWAHEIGHLWWHGAPPTGWENWLDESFAEYSSWRYIRAVKGEEAFNKLLDDARKNSANKPPVWGTSRQSPDGYAVLYFKGGLCLYELEKMLGPKEFEAFTADLYAKNIKSTAALLDLLQQLSSPEIRQHFEALLKQ
jgi:Peptidase family M1 domain